MHCSTKDGVFCNPMVYMQHLLLALILGNFLLAANANEVPSISLGDGTTFHVNEQFTHFELFPPPSPILFMAQGKEGLSFISVLHLKGEILSFDYLKSAISLIMNQKQLTLQEFANKENQSFELQDVEGTTEYEASYFIKGRKLFLLVAPKSIFHTLAPDFQSMFSYQVNNTPPDQPEFSLWHLLTTALLFLFFIFFIWIAIRAYSKLTLLRKE